MDSTQRTEKRKRESERTLYRMIEGACVKCGKRPQSPTSVKCSECAAKQVKRLVDREHAMILAGLCRKCGKRPFLKEGVTYCSKCYPRILDRAKNWHKPYLELVYGHYGRRCACCGETEPMFLTIDHVNNDGNAHRKKVRPAAIPKVIVDSGFPESFQILCFNCNCGKHRNGGVCPHKKGQ